MTAKLEDNDEVLLRQIHPSWVSDGVPSSQAFTPTQKDEGLLSLSRSSKMSAKQAFEYHVEVKKLDAVSCFGITVGECGSQGIPCKDDPVLAVGDTPADPAHAVADFTEYGTNKQKTLGQRLKRAALTRGQLHPAT